MKKENKGDFWNRKLKFYIIVVIIVIFAEVVLAEDKTYTDANIGDSYVSPTDPNTNNYNGQASYDIKNRKAESHSGVGVPYGQGHSWAYVGRKFPVCGPTVTAYMWGM